MAPTLSEFIRDIRAAAPAEHAFFLYLADCVIEVRTNSPELDRELQAYFGSFARPRGQADILVTAHETPVPPLPFAFRTKEPDPGKSRIKEEWADIPGGRIVRKRLTGVVMAFGGGEHAVAGSCLDNPNQVVNFINNRYIERKLDQGCLLGHAAGTSLGGVGMALAGFSGMGKSTLALHVVSLGADFVSNDRVLVGPGPRPILYGVAKHPRINPGTALNNPDLVRVMSAADRERFRSLPPQELWSLEHKYDAIVEDCYGFGRFRLNASFRGVVFLNWRRDGGALRMERVDPAQRRDLLPAIMKSPGLFYPSAELLEKEEPPVEAWLGALSDRSVFEFSGGVDFPRAARAVMEILRTGGLPVEAGRPS